MSVILLRPESSPSRCGVVSTVYLSEQRQDRLSNLLGIAETGQTGSRPSSSICDQTLSLSIELVNLVCDR